MRTHGFRLFAIASMLALLSGGQLCMLVQCSPKTAPGAAHGCCSKAAGDPAPAAPAPHASARPCCIEVALSGAPQLEPPAAAGTHLPSEVPFVSLLAAAPPAARPASPPGDDDSPPPAPPLTAAGSRAPPLG